MLFTRLQSAPWKLVDLVNIFRAHVSRSRDQLYNVSLNDSCFELRLRNGDFKDNWVKFVFALRDACR